MLSPLFGWKVAMWKWIEWICWCFFSSSSFQWGDRITSESNRIEQNTNYYSRFMYIYRSVSPNTWAHTYLSSIHMSLYKNIHISDLHRSTRHRAICMVSFSIFICSFFRSSSKFQPKINLLRLCGKRFISVSLADSYKKHQYSHTESLCGKNEHTHTQTHNIIN